MKRMLFVTLLLIGCMEFNELKAQDCTLGELQLFALNFTPRNWAPCNGQIMIISQHSALYALLGTTYGGDGRNTFALPDMRGRLPVGAGKPPSGQDIKLGGTYTYLQGDATLNSMQALGLNYNICIEGIFPSRQ